MSADIATDEALSRIDSLLAEAPACVRERWREVDAYLRETASDTAGEIAAAVHGEEDLLDQISVRARMFSGATRQMEIVLEFPFDIRSWFDGHSHFEFEPEESGRSEDDRMLDFYRRQEAERNRTMALVRSSVAPIAFDCLRRQVGQDARRGEDNALYALRHAVWRSGDRTGPRPSPAGGEPVRTTTIVDGVITEKTE